MNDSIARQRSSGAEPMKGNRYTKKEIRAGEKLRDEIFAKLAAKGVHPSFSSQMSYPLDYMRGDNIRSVVVQPRNGGWVADVIFRDVPAGRPACIGSKDVMPFGTRQAAREAALVLVEALLNAPSSPGKIMPITEIPLGSNGKNIRDEYGLAVYCI